MYGAIRTTPRCGRCGLFCRVHDEYTHFGGSADLEPPDPIYLCERCSKEIEQQMVEGTDYPARPHLPWRFGACHRRALTRLGMVVAGPEHAAWAEAFWPDKVPPGYEIWPGVKGKS